MLQWNLIHFNIPFPYYNHKKIKKQKTLSHLTKQPNDTSKRHQSLQQRAKASKLIMISRSSLCRAGKSSEDGLIDAADDLFWRSELDPFFDPFI
jgi:hypothetical protein